MTSREGSSSEIVDNHTPLWKYVTKLEKIGRGGENWRWKYSYYLKTFNGSYSRVKAHLMQTKNKNVGNG